MIQSATLEEREAGRGYEALFVPALFQPWTRHVLNGADVGLGARVLDVACGSGVLAREALARGANVTGLDAAPGMLAAAEEVEPGIAWVHGVAEDLPFEAEAFDRVVSQFGIMFFQDRQGAVAEMHRVLAPTGRVSVAAWSGIEHNAAYRDEVALMRDMVSDAAGDAVSLPFSLGEPDVLVGLMEKAGFVDVQVETAQEQAKFPSVRTMVDAELRGWLPLFDIHLDEDKITEVLAAAEIRLAAYATESGDAEFETAGYVVSGQKPG